MEIFKTTYKMKKIIINLLCFICIALNMNSQEKLNINTQKSSIKWIGEYTFYFGGHDGFIKFKEGFFIKTGELITGGEFIIDMNSITNSDIETSEARGNLVAHLKDPDFFDVKKHPTSKLTISKVQYSDKTHARIDANLTLKGITKPVHFNVEFVYKEKQMKTRFKIDRRNWNVNYTSKIKNSAISDAIGFEISVKL